MNPNIENIVDEKYNELAIELEVLEFLHTTYENALIHNSEAKRTNTAGYHINVKLNDLIEQVELDMENKKEEINNYLFPEIEEDDNDE